jgi:hypothetical protein
MHEGSCPEIAQERTVLVGFAVQQKREAANDRPLP